MSCTTCEVGSLFPTFRIRLQFSFLDMLMPDKKTISSSILRARKKQASIKNCIMKAIKLECDVHCSRHYKCAYQHVFFTRTTINGSVLLILSLQSSEARGELRRPVQPCNLLELSNRSLVFLYAAVLLLYLLFRESIFMQNVLL